MGAVYTFWRVTPRVPSAPGRAAANCNTVTVPVPLLAHALPKSVGAVPLTLILTGLLAAFLAVNAVGTRRAAGRIGGGAHPTGTIDGLSIPWASLPLSKASLASTGNVIGLVLLIWMEARAAAAGPAPAAEGQDEFETKLNFVAGATGRRPYESALPGWWEFWREKALFPSLPGAPLAFNTFFARRGGH